MAKPDISTLLNSPKAGFKDVLELQESDVFAWLRPVNHIACEAFDATVDFILKQPPESPTFDHFRQFLHSPSREPRAQSILSDDDDPGHDLWAGAFGLRLNVLPKNPARGWCIGTSRGQKDPEDVDLMLAPPTDSWKKVRVSGNHARLTFHPESSRIRIEAKHTVVISKYGQKIFREPSSFLLDDGETVNIGSCMYHFQYTRYFTSPAFEKDLTEYMETYCNHLWSANRHLSPSSVATPMRIGNYCCSPSAFAQGTFAKVNAGWNDSGRAVAIKTFKKPEKSEISSHIQLMKYIGSHVGILFKGYKSFANSEDSKIYFNF